MAKIRRTNFLRDSIIFVAGGVTSVTLAAGLTVGSVALVGLSINGASINNAVGRDIFSEDYKNKTALELVMTFVNNEIDFSSLEGIAKLTPQVDELYEYLNGYISDLGITIDKEALYATKWEDMGDFFMNTVTESFTVAGFIGANESSEAIIKYLCFPKDENGGYMYDSPYTLKDMMSEGFMDRMVQNITLEDVMENIPTDNYLLNAIKSWHISDFKDTDTLYGLKISDIYGVAGSGIIAALSDFSISDLNNQEKIEGLLIGSLMGDTNTNVKTEYTSGENPEPTVTVISNELTSSEGSRYVFTVTFSDMSTFTYTRDNNAEPSKVYLGEDDYYHISSNPDNSILVALSKYKIGSIKSNASVVLESLTIKDLAGDIPSDNYLLKAIEDKTISYITGGDFYTDLTIEDILGKDSCDENALLNSLRDKSLDDLANEETFNGLTLEQLLGSDACDSSSLLNALRGETISTLKEGTAFNNLTLVNIFGDPYDAVENPDGYHYEDNPLINAIKDLSLTDMKDYSNIENAIIGLSVNELLGSDASDNSFISLIGNYTLADLKGETLFNTLTIGEIMGNINTHIVHEYEEEEVLIENVVVSQTLIDEDEDNKIATYLIEFSNGDEFEYECTYKTSPSPKNLYVLNNEYWVRINDSSAVNTAVETWSIKDLKDGSKFNDIRVLDLIGEVDETSSPVLNAMRDITIGELNEAAVLTALQEIPLKAFIKDYDEEHASPIIKLFADTTLGGMEEKIDSLTFGDIITDTTNPILLAIKDKPIKNAAEVFSNLTLGDLSGFNVTVTSNLPIGPNVGETADIYEVTFSDASTYQYEVEYEPGSTETKPYEVSVCETSSNHYFVVTPNGNLDTGVDSSLNQSGIFAKIPAATKLTDLTDVVSSMPLTTLFEDQIYYDDAGVKKIDSTWKFLLTPEGTELASDDLDKAYYQTYTVNDMTQLVANFKYHVEHATLRQLDTIGALGADGQAILNKELGLIAAGYIYGMSEAAAHQHDLYGDLHLADIVTIISHM